MIPGTTLSLLDLKPFIAICLQHHFQECFAAKNNCLRMVCFLNSRVLLILIHLIKTVLMHFSLNFLVSTFYIHCNKGANYYVVKENARTGIARHVYGFLKSMATMFSYFKPTSLRSKMQSWIIFNSSLKQLQKMLRLSCSPGLLPLMAERVINSFWAQRWFYPGIWQQFHLLSHP